MSGTLFGLLVGWIIGSQQAGRRAPAAAPAAAASGSQASGRATAAPALDVQRAAELERTASAQPANAAVRVELGNLYFDAERFDLAVPWYEAALKLDPKNVDVSTDLGVCYYYTNQVDRALAQLDHSLAIDPKHVEDAAQSGHRPRVRQAGSRAARPSRGRRSSTIAPDSEEARRAPSRASTAIKPRTHGGAPRRGSRRPSAAQDRDACALIICSDRPRRS